MTVLLKFYIYGGAGIATPEGCPHLFLLYHGRAYYTTAGQMYTAVVFLYAKESWGTADRGFGGKSSDAGRAWGAQSLKRRGVVPPSAGVLIGSHAPGGLGSFVLC